MQMPQDRIIRVGQIKTRYWAEGSGGTPIVLIHGLGGFVESWSANFDTLAGRQRVYALDLPGHGRSDKPMDMAYGIADLAGFLKDFLSALEIERACLVGHSLGGALAAQFTLLYPSVVERLVLVSSAGLGRELAAGLRLGTLPGLGETFTRPVRARTRISAQTLIHNPKMITEQLLDLFYEMASQPGAHAAYLKTLRANVDWRGQQVRRYAPIVQGLGTIRQPVLIIWGREDRLVPVSHAEFAAKRPPDGQVEIFEGCGHIPMYEHSSRFDAALLDFLDRKA